MSPTQMDGWSGRVFVLALAVASAGCWVKRETGEKMQADILALQTELEVIKLAREQETAALNQRIQEADQRLAELNLVLEEVRRVTGRNAADVGVDLETLRGQLMELRGYGEVNQHRLEIIEKRLSIIHGDLNNQRAEAVRREEDRARVLQEEQKRKAEEAAKRDPLSALKRPEKQEEFYKLAYGLLEAGQTSAARQLFSEFLQKWPKGSYADNALYWLAESYYAESNWRDAALAFQRVRSEYPKGDKAPDALLKLGLCFQAMGRYKESLPFLREFVQSHPRHPQAERARQKIREGEKALRGK